MFQINDKVVCVNDAAQVGKGDSVKKDVIYVVRGVYLVGRFIGMHSWGEEWGFRPDRFRKLSDIKAENAAKRTEFCSA